jgi:hypothetical protein
VIGIGEELLELAVMQRVQIHLPVLEVMRLDQTGRLNAALDRCLNRVVGADGLVGGVPEPEGLLWDRDAEAALEVAHGVAGRVAQVVAAHGFHDDLDRIRGVLGHQIREGMAAAGAPPALTCLVAGDAQTLLDNGFGAALGAAGDGWIGGR